MTSERKPRLFWYTAQQAFAIDAIAEVQDTGETVVVKLVSGGEHWIGPQMRPKLLEILHHA